MNILVLGDIVGKQGCEFVREKLPSFKRLKGIDICIANGENSAVGNGITPDSAQFLFDSGVDFLTTGNHVYKRREVFDFLDERDDIIRPANFYHSNPGKGTGIIDLGRTRIEVINLSGNYSMDCNTNAFLCADEILKENENIKIKIVDFHAEATSEKKALGYYLDGRVSVLFGTHTHVQTADEQILPNGTGYITDVGMCGPTESVLGVDKDIIIKKMCDNMPSRFETANGPCMINGCIFEINENTGKTVSVERVNIC